MTTISQDPRPDRLPDPAQHLALQFVRRAARAHALAAQSPAARDTLDFAAGLFEAQGALTAAIAHAHGDRPLCGRLDQDVAAFAGAFDPMLTFAIERGPPGLREVAEGRRAGDAIGPVVAAWAGGTSGREDYLSRAILRCYAEALAGFGVAPHRPGLTGACAFCRGVPWIAWRVAGGEADGAQRFLGCALCGNAWPAGRILCPACGEQDPAKLAAFQSDRHPAVRIETCTTCRVYVKSIDLTVDARAIPEVDDLLSLSMDLWAIEEGYTRLESGLAGL
jgi:hypothetical protein